MPSILMIRKANKASSSQLSASISMHADSSIPYRFSLARASELRDGERTSVWDIFESNMRDLYMRSSFGWDPPSKHKELFDPNSRFMLARTDSAESCPALVGFVMFRFEHEDEENIVYCYDLQISGIAQRSGLGKIFMQHLATIGTAWRMDKIMLTVFKENMGALRFYQANGFTVDPSSPSKFADEPEWEDVDYEIMSMALR